MGISPHRHSHNKSRTTMLVILSAANNLTRHKRLFAALRMTPVLDNSQPNWHNPSHGAFTPTYTRIRGRTHRMPQPVNSQRSQPIAHDSLSSQPATPMPVRVAFQGERGAFGDE